MLYRGPKENGSLKLAWMETGLLPEIAASLRCHSTCSQRLESRAQPFAVDERGLYSEMLPDSYIDGAESLSAQLTCGTFWNGAILIGRSNRSVYWLYCWETLRHTFLRDKLNSTPLLN